MPPLTLEQTQAAQTLIDLALAEDLGTAGDRTSQALLPTNWPGQAVITARSAGVVAGMPLVEMTLASLDPLLRVNPLASDGDRIQPGQPLAQCSGPMRSLLSAERTALNFLQRLSGIASLTRQFLDAVAGLNVAILDTRKTTPGWRRLEKYAVRVGGGSNHRFGLYDAIMIKDNHLAALASTHNAIDEALRRAHAHGDGVPIILEVDDLTQLQKVLRCADRPDIILLDNMSFDQLREAVALRNAHAPDILLEASGGVNLHTVRRIAETGVDRISVGALTHSAVALDIGLDYA